MTNRLIYTDLTKKALKMCFEAHKDQVDKSGLPYVFHPFHLAEQMTDESTIVVSLLHDVLEDTDYSVQDLRTIGIPEQMIEALMLLSHDKKIPYMDYIRQIRENPIAKAVKIADLKHNSDVGRLNDITAKDNKRIQKYMIALAILQDDKFDSTLGYYRKIIPLDSKRLYFLSVFYSPDEVLKYSLDVEAASDSHFEFSAEDGESVRKLLNENLSLPEALAEYLVEHSENSLLSLMEQHKISYQSFHYN